MNIDIDELAFTLSGRVISTEHVRQTLAPVFEERDAAVAQVSKMDRELDEIDEQLGWELARVAELEKALNRLRDGDFHGISIHKGTGAMAVIEAALKGTKA